MPLVKREGGMCHRGTEHSADPSDRLQHLRWPAETEGAAADGTRVQPGHVPALRETLTQENAGEHFHVDVIKRPYLTQSSCSNIYFLLSTLSFLPRVKLAAVHTGNPPYFYSVL